MICVSEKFCQWSPPHGLTGAEQAARVRDGSPRRPGRPNCRDQGPVWLETFFINPYYIKKNLTIL